ncbi:alpha/beta fold hydrolase [Microbacterium esteraromaticum]|uniref:alpha/beta fold hydrolase n=1 Tax=Microbacterium esteraromaticum TaxID=57043 RepID=UPI00195C33CB|nr:alpha/beta hydrolase [Microbacterium esteraromaticum]MBM7464693.1 pimeloyl-ACP methyl ester carboxylesterase [Microbacterium esteraromaticum]
MDIILIPGLWLDASSWDDVTPILSTAGHRVHPMTMPGLGEAAPEVGMADWVDAVVALIDDLEGPVALVGHSGGGNVVWGAADARPDRVARVIFVDTVPPAPDRGIGEFEVVEGVVPFPGWDHFPDEDVHDLDDETRARTAAQTTSIPARVPSDPISLADERRFAVPVTLLMGAYDRQRLEAELADWGPWGAEFASIADATVVTLGSGHWPQFSMPERLATAILDAVRS